MGGKSATKTAYFEKLKLLVSDSSYRLCANPFQNDIANSDLA